MHFIPNNVPLIRLKRYQTRPKEITIDDSTAIHQLSPLEVIGVPIVIYKNWQCLSCASDHKSSVSLLSFNAIFNPERLAPFQCQTHLRLLIVPVRFGYQTCPVAEPNKTDLHD